MSNVERAAHVDHTIEHSHTDLGNFIGLGLGIVAGIAIVATGGLAAAPLACGVAVLGGDIGSFIGGLFPNREDSGHIARGSPTVFYGPETKPAARMRDRTACYSPGMPTMERITPFLAMVSPVFAGMSALAAIRGINRAVVVNFEMGDLPVLPSDSEPGAHAGSYLADGSETVFIETWPAVRDKDGVYPCDGKVSSGIDSILIGGPRCRMRGTEVRNEIDRGQRWTQGGIEILGDILDFRNPLAWLRNANRLLSLIDERLADRLKGVIALLQIPGILERRPRNIRERAERVVDGIGVLKDLWGARATYQGPPPAPNSFDPVTRRVGPPIYPSSPLLGTGR